MVFKSPVIIKTESIWRCEITEASMTAHEFFLTCWDVWVVHTYHTRMLSWMLWISYQHSEWESSAVSDSLRPHGLYPTRLFCPWNFPGKSTGVGYHFLLQGIFVTQGLNLGLLPCRQMLYHLSHQGSPPISIVLVTNGLWDMWSDTLVAI